MDELNLLGLTYGGPIPLGLAICMHVLLTVDERSLEDTSLHEADAAVPAMMVCQLDVFHLSELQKGSVGYEGEVAAATRRAGEGAEGTEGMDKGAVLKHD